MPAPTPVLLLVRELGIGGCERDLAKLAKGLDRSRFTPHVACFHPEGLRSQEVRASGVPILHLPVRSFLSRSFLDGARLMHRYLQQHKIPIVHAFDTPTDLFAVPVAKLCRIPVVIASNLFHREMMATVQKGLFRVVDRLADVTVVNSKAIQDHLIHDVGVPEHRTYLCYNGVETDVFFPKPAPKPAPVADASLVIGSVCALREEKSLHLLLEAFARVRHLREGMKLLIVGSGAMLASLEAQRRQLGLEQVCHLEPAKQDVADWMRAMDIFVLPSRSEGFPNSVLEAMSCGCCTIGSRVGGIPEQISHLESGLLFDPGDVPGLVSVLQQAIENDELRRRLGIEAARVAKERFSMKVNIERMQSLYDSLLARTGGYV